MLKIDNYEVTGWEHTIRGARNPLNSWHRMDSSYGFNVNGLENQALLGPNDYKLLKKLTNAGSDHGKFMRMITVYVDITAPLYWWKEFDTYKIGTVANSCSTMHKIHAKEFEMSDFSNENLNEKSLCILRMVIDELNECRNDYLKTKDKEDWWQMIQLLPSSYNQKRTIMLNYEVLKNMYNSRRHHKLDEWHTLCDWIELLPYHDFITGETYE